MKLQLIQWDVRDWQIQMHQFRFKNFKLLSHWCFQFRQKMR